MQPLDTTAPFTFAEGLAAGFSRRQLAGEDFVRLTRGIYVAGRASTWTRGGALLSRLADDAHLSHQSAAELHGLWVEPTALLHVCRAGRTRLKRHDVASHQCPRHGPGRAEGDVWVRDGIAASSPITCFLELADTLELVDLVVLGDSVVAKGYASPAELIGRASVFRGDGALRARQAARLVRARVESRQETRLRLVMVMGGLPEPTPNLEIRTPAGRWRRLDLGYEGWKVGAEYEGRQHAADSLQWRSDIARREEFDHLGWRLVLVESTGIYREPRRTVERIEVMLRLAGWAGRRQPWRDFDRHFPGWPRT